MQAISSNRAVPRLFCNHNNKYKLEAGAGGYQRNTNQFGNAIYILHKHADYDFKKTFVGF